MNCFKNFSESTANVLSHFCNKTIKSDNLLSNYLVEILARQIVESYKLIDESRIPSPGEEFSVSVEELDRSEYSSFPTSPRVALQST